jgi:hypothetical protein
MVSLRRCQRWPVFRRSRKGQADKGEMPTTSPNTVRSMCQRDSYVGRVFSDQDLMEPTGCDFREAFHPRAYCRKKVRHVFGL